MLLLHKKDRSTSLPQSISIELLTAINQTFDSEWPCVFFQFSNEKKRAHMVFVCTKCFTVRLDFAIYRIIIIIIMEKKREIQHNKSINNIKRQKI